MRYQPETPILEKEWLHREFQRVANAFTNQIDISYAAPDKPRAGLIVYADGTYWNPGSGEGLYRYNLAGAWVFIG